MRHATYAMQFEGRAEPAGEGMLRAALRSPSSRISSTVGERGLESRHEAVDGGTAEFTSEVRLTGESSFTETGTIQFGEGNSFNFSTIGDGYIAPSPEEGLQHGAIVWRVENGRGQFEGASGIITSNFTLSADGEVADRQYGAIWIR